MILAIGVGHVEFPQFLVDIRRQRAGTIDVRSHDLYDRTSSVSSIQNSGRAFIDFFTAFLSWGDVASASQGVSFITTGLGGARNMQKGWLALVSQKDQKNFFSLCMAWLASRHNTEEELCLVATWTGASLFYTRTNVITECISLGEGREET
jgi:hypothetical protein